MGEKRATSWRAPTTLDEVRRRAGGRRRFNALRRLEAFERRCKVVHLLQEHYRPLTGRGTAAWVARQLGVHRSTALRDLRIIQADPPPSCPMCRRLRVPLLP